MMNGSFTATPGANVAILSPADFAIFLSSPATFECSVASIDCFTTGPVSAGNIDVNLPVYVSEQSGGPVVVTPYYLVQQNPNPSLATNVTWTTSLVAGFVDVYA